MTEWQSYRRVWLSPGVTVWLGLHSGGDLHVLGPFPPTLLSFPYSGFTQPEPFAVSRMSMPGS